MNVLIVTENDFPNEDAGAIRDMAFAQIYQKMGYDVFCICHNHNRKSGVADGVKYISLYKKHKNTCHKLCNYIALSARFQKAYEKYVENNGTPDVLHVVSTNPHIYKFLYQTARETGCTMIYTAVEWYSACEFKHGIFSRPYLMCEYFHRKMVRKPVKVIAISRYLENYFQKKGIDTVRIPVIMDCKQEIKVVSKEKTSIAYIGSPWGKDQLENIVKAFVGMEKSVSSQLALHIVGVEKGELIKHGCISKEQLDAFNESIFVYGRVAHEKSIEILRQMDFSIVVRNAKKRYAKAGFPTKSVEALCNGAAVICNYSSDLSYYLVHMQNAVILTDESVEAVRNGFREVAALTERKIIKMRKNAKKTAEVYFHNLNYVDIVKRII